MPYIELAFVVACVVAVLQAIGRHIPVPMAILQMAAGVALSAFAALSDLREQSALLFVMLVPPLLYVEARHIPKRELWQSIRPVLGMAMGLVALTTVAVGYGLHAMVPTMPLAMCFALAAALSSTDTVAVSGLVRRIPLPPRMQILLSGESLLNDSVALVAFKVAVAACVTATFSAGDAAASLLTISVGGLATGAVVAVVATTLRRVLQSDGTDGVRVDTTLSLLTPYAAYLASEQLGVSGVLAVVAAGLCAGVLERQHLRADTRLHGSALWGTATLVLNGAVFVMLGLQMRQVLHRVEGHNSAHLLGYVLALTFALFALRLVWTLALDWRMRRQHRSPHASAPDPQPSPGWAMLMVPVLCGVRGSLALSATLSIPLLTATGAAMPGRDLAVFLSASTIAATLLLSGLMLPLLQIRPGAVADDVAPTVRHTRVAIAGAAVRAIDTSLVDGVSSQVREWGMAMRHLHESRMASSQSADSLSAAHRAELGAQRDLSMRVLRAQRQELHRLHQEDGVTEGVLQAFELEFDLAEIALTRLAWSDPQPA